MNLTINRDFGIIKTSKDTVSFDLLTGDFMDYEIKVILKNIVDEALLSNYKLEGSDCFYSNLSCYSEDHLFNEKIASKFAIQCKCFSVTDNECIVGFEFSSHIKDVLKKYGIVNSICIEVMNPTGDAWIASSEILDEYVCPSDDIGVNFTSDSAEKSFHFEEFVKDLEHAKLKCLIEA